MRLRKRPVAYAAVLLLLTLPLATPARGDEKAPPGDGGNKNEVVVIDNDFRVINIFEAAGGRIGVTIGGGPKMLVPTLGPFSEQRQPQAILTKDGDVIILYVGRSPALGISAVFVARIPKGQSTLADARGVAATDADHAFVNIAATVDPFPASPHFNSIYVVGQVNPKGSGLGELGLMISRDGAQTWSLRRSKDVNDTLSNSAPGAQVGPGGTVYIATNQLVPGEEKVALGVSSDGGGTFTWRHVPFRPDPGFPHQPPSICPHGGSNVSLMGTDCSDGTCRIAQWRSSDGGDTWSRRVPAQHKKRQGHHRSKCREKTWHVILDQEAGNGPLSDIMYFESTDDGATWSTPVRVNDQSRDVNGVIKQSTAGYPEGASPRISDAWVVVDLPPPAAAATSSTAPPRSRGFIPGTQVFPVWTALTAPGQTDVFTAGTPPGNSLLAAVLPGSRSVQVGVAATAFVTIINTGTTTATGVGISLLTDIPATFSYQTTDAANLPTGTPDTAVDIPAGESRTFVIAITPTAPFPPADILLGFAGTNTATVRTVIGLNTLVGTASATPVPDVVALAATPNNNGIVDLAGATGVAAFAVATANVGASGDITVAAGTGDVSLPLTITVCQTDPVTGLCQALPTPGVQTTIGAGQTPTFGVFIAGDGIVPFDPAGHRIVVIFTDTQGVIRGSTSVAVRTL